MLVVVLAGCASPGSSGDGGGPADSGAPAATGADGGAELEQSGDGGDDGSAGGATEAGGGSASATDALASLDRSIVRTGSVDLTVDSYEAARDAVSAETRRYGGYVGGSSQTLHEGNNETWTTGQVVLRVPADRFEDLLSFVKDRGTVRAVETSTEDVTDRLVELDARLTNLEEKRSRLRTFYDRANSTNELLAVEERLSSVQGEIERLKAKRRALEDRVAYSTLRVGIAEPEPEPPDDEPDPERATLVGAFLGSVRQLVDGGYTLLVGLAAVAPFALAVGVPAAAGYGVYRRLGIGPVFGRRSLRFDSPGGPDRAAGGAAGASDADEDETDASEPSPPDGDAESDAGDR